MKKTIFFLQICILFFSVINSFALDQQMRIDNGIAFLNSAQLPDGSWNSDKTTAYYASTEVLSTLSLLNKKDANYANGMNWLTFQIADNNDYLSKKELLLTSSDDLNALLSYQLLSAGWATYSDSVNSSIIDTALALQALNAVNYSDQTVIASAISYLLSTQNTDGGWAFYQGDDSNVYMTSIVSWTLQQFPQTTSIATAINKATTYIINQQQTDGSWGTVYETAYAYIALVGVTTDNTVLGNAIAYLTSNQASNGSWNDDPYSTALALRALYYSENKPVPPPQPTTGSITGTIIDASTNQPLGNVSVSVVSNQPSANTTTDSAGHFSNQQAGARVKMNILCNR